MPRHEISDIAIVGSTGSVGVQTLEVARSLRIGVRALAAYGSVEALLVQALEFRPKIVSLGSPEAANAFLYALKSVAPNRSCSYTPEIVFGDGGLRHAAAGTDAPTTVVAATGLAGLTAAVAAAKAGKRLALANKESLVAGGDLIWDAAAGFAGGARYATPPIIPVDSEHSAIFQCLMARGRHDISIVDGMPTPCAEGWSKAGSRAISAHRTDGLANIILTASGGPFIGYSYDEMSRVTPEQALRHPVWRMGNKITIDSATMANKGLEVIEAAVLFGESQDGGIKVVIHPQGVAHSMVEFKDGSVIAQLGVPDMRTPIQIAITWPLRLEGLAPSLNLAAVKSLTFEEPDENKFPCLSLAYEAKDVGGNAPAIYSAADDVAVELFLAGRLRFTDIARVIRKTMDAAVGRLDNKPWIRRDDNKEIDERLVGVLAVDAEARVIAGEIGESLSCR